jgi:hypothetical protein
LCDHPPIRLDWAGFDRLRIAFIPQRRPACRGNVGRLGFHPDVIEDVSDVGAVRDEGL